MASWETKDIVIVAVAVAGVVVNGGIALFNQFFSSRRYGREKIWDLRRAIYSKVTYELSRAVVLFDVILRDIGPGVPEWRRGVFAAWKHIDNACKTQRDNYLVCSKAFSNVMSTLPS